MDGGLGAANGADSKDAESRGAVGQVFALEKCGCGCRGGGLGIAEARRPLRGADDVAVGADDLKEIELRVLGEGLRFREIGRGVAGLDHFKGHGADALAGCEAIDGGGDFSGACWNSR